MDKNKLQKTFIKLIQDLNKGVAYKSKKMPRLGVYRVSKVGRLVDDNGKSTDGWFIANKLMNVLNYIYLDESITTQEFYEMPIRIFSKYIEIKY